MYFHIIYISLSIPAEDSEVTASCRDPLDCNTKYYIAPYFVKVHCPEPSNACTDAASTDFPWRTCPREVEALVSNLKYW